MDFSFHFYDLPSLPSKRYTSLGYGKKGDYEKNIGCGSNQLYAAPSYFDPKKSSSLAYSFGKAKRLNKSKDITPGPKYLSHLNLDKDILPGRPGVKCCQRLPAEPVGIRAHRDCRADVHLWFPWRYDYRNQSFAGHLRNLPHSPHGRQYSAAYLSGCVYRGHGYAGRQCHCGDGRYIGGP